MAITTLLILQFSFYFSVLLSDTHQGRVWNQTTQPGLVVKPCQRRELNPRPLGVVGKFRDLHQLRCLPWPLPEAPRPVHLHDAVAPPRPINTQWLLVSPLVQPDRSHPAHHGVSQAYPGPTPNGFRRGSWRSWAGIRTSCHQRRPVSLAWCRLV
jgi:hypothetical protein